ncbi:MAG TPA: hypothetical protein D7H79_00050 [Candidatus Poseidoniales archaeon]|nr:MAG TPA: hypothetical protein D7H79_00050 [Candidatus Poseidoniales archaeon]
MMNHSSSARILVVLLLLTLFLPFVQAEVEPRLTSNTMAQEADADNPAEYTITVHNDGDDDMSVSLSTQQDASNCNGFSSQIEQVSGTIDAGSSESVTLTVSVTEQADGDCETTVNAQATVSGGIPGTPKNADITVTTTAGDGGGLYGVKLSTDEPNVEYDGEDRVVWDVEVENTGEQDNANIQLEIVSDNDCESDDLTATVDPSIVQLNSGDKETVEVEVDVPDGSSTEAGEHCFILQATVTNDPNQADQASDNLTLQLDIPEVKECDSQLSTSSHNLDPFESATNSFSVENVGNTEWTVTMQATSADADISGWVTFDSPKSKLLSKPGGSEDNHEFTLTTSPDDSVEAGTQVEIKIRGMSNQGVGCENILTVTIGQVHDAKLSLSTSKISNVEPGSSGTVTITVENRGNGIDTFSLTTVELPEGWQVSFSQSSVTVNSKHDSNNKASLSADINVPSNALAGDNTVIFGVSVSGSTTILDSKSLTVSVAANHDLTAVMPSTQQTGRSGQIVQFPLDITNTGNIQDTFKLQVCDPHDNTGCNPPMWASSYSDSSGNSITQVVLGPGESERVFLDITVEGEEDADSVNVLSRVAIFGSGEKVEQEVSVIVSNYDYGMAISPEEPGSVGGELDVVLPPGGVMEISFWVENTGNYPGGDNAVISMTGMESSVLRKVMIDGVIVSGDIQIASGERVLITVQLEALSGVSTGTTGVIKVSASSEKNAAQSTFVNLNFEVRTIHDLRFTLEGTDSLMTDEKTSVEFILHVTNYGNVFEEVQILTSDSLRGWTVNVISEEFDLSPGETKEVTVRVTPPADMVQDDAYKFTLTVQPKGMPVAGQPLDLEVTAEVSPGLNLISEENKEILVYGLTIIGALLVVVLFLRSRSENKRIMEALDPQPKSQNQK